MSKQDWFSRLGVITVAVIGSLSALTLARCFSPELPACSYRCNMTEPRCPDEYECRTDGYCHLKGNDAECPYMQDLQPPPVRDLSSPPRDLAQPQDQSMGDAMPNPG